MFRLRTGSGSSSGRACSSPRTRENRPPQAPKKASNRGVRNKKSFERSGGIKASSVRGESLFRMCATLPPLRPRHAACVLVLLGALLLQQLFQEPAQQQRLRLRRVFTKTAASSSSLFFHHQMEEEGGGYLSAQVDGWIAIPPQLICKLSPAAATPLPFRPSIGRELSLPMNPESPPRWFDAKVQKNVGSIGRP